MSYHPFVEKLLDGAGVAWVAVDSLFNLRNGYTPSKSNKSYWENGSVPWFRMEDIRENGQILNDSIQKVSAEAVKGGRLFPANSIIMATSATIGIHALITVPYLSNQQFTNLSLKSKFKDSLLIKYIYYCCFPFADWCQQNTTISSFASVDMVRFKQYKIPIPCPENPEKSLRIQAEIVRILDAMTSLKNELKLRKQEYQYYRDFLLSEEELGKTGFEWRTLGELALIQRGASPRPISKFITDDPKGIPWIKIGDTVVGSKFVNATTQRITREGAKRSRILDIGDFIISNSMSFGRPYILDIKGAIHDGWASISQFGQHLNSSFLYHYLSSSIVQNYWQNKINSGSVSNLNADIIKSLPIPIPPPRRTRADCFHPRQV